MKLVLSMHLRKKRSQFWRHKIYSDLISESSAEGETVFTFKNSSIPEDYEHSFIDQGYFLWKSALEQAYPNRFACNKSFHCFRHSTIWQKGFYAIDSSHSVKKCLEAQSILFGKEGSRKDPKNASIEEWCANKLERDWLKCFIQASLKEWSDNHLPPGLSLVPWRILAYTTNPQTLHESTNWHYDVNMPDNVIFFMLNLNESTSNQDPVGTHFLEANASKLLSITSGYTSLPIWERVSDLESVNSHGLSLIPDFIDSKAGRLLVFMPGRVLHKAEFGLLGFRDNIHISACIVNAEDDVMTPDGCIYKSEEVTAASSMILELSMASSRQSVAPPYLCCA